MMYSKLLVLIMWLVFISPSNISAEQVWQATFGQSELEIHMNSVKVINLTITGIQNINSTSYIFYVRSENPHLVNVEKIINSSEIFNNEWSGDIPVQALFMGKTKVFVELEYEKSNKTEQSSTKLDVIITREMRAIDHIFTGSVIVLVSLLYINFGAALDLEVMNGILKRPIGPAIGFICQFLFMPMLSFGLGYVLFPHSPELRLGMFFTGVSPAGGASNIWTVILRGNINLSIAMTALSNFAAFGMIPLWLFTLGKVIFESAEIGVPYRNIAFSAVGLIIPLIIGVAIQKYLPRISRVLVRLLTPISSVLIIFIIIFAIVTNLYLFELFSWQIIVAGLGLPLLGYIFGGAIARILKQSSSDALAISIETGVQNTGIAIFLLRFSLKPPAADLTTIIPVSVAMMTPLPLSILYIYLRIKRRQKNPEVERLIVERTTHSPSA